MKVRVLHRQEGCGVPSGPGALQRLAANRDPRLHPFQKEREYSRALVATKLKKLFAKPFVAALEAHTDGVKAIAKSRTHPAVIFSSSCNGEVCAWNLAAKKCTANIKAHDGFAREAAAELQRDEGLLQQLPAKNQLTCSGLDPHPVNVFMADSPVTSVDYHWNRHLFVSTGEAVQLWEPNRSVPLQTFSWASDGVYCAKFNPSETSLLAAGLSGNSIALYDIRGNTPIRRVLMKMKTNALSWNPQEPLNFTAANEDGCLYTFDLRRLSEASRVYKDFVNAVLDVDYSPTGQEFVAASFDGTLRIFKTQEGRSRDVYHTRRMQSVLSCGFSSDSRFVFSGSADMCIRVWKAAAAALLGPQNPRQRAAVNYRQTLVDKFAHLPEIRRIERHHHVPKLIKKTQEKKRIMREAAKRREDNRIAHSKPGTVKRVAERKKSIYREIE